MEPSSGQRKMIVGIDFGTEKTCVSYAAWNSFQKEPPPISSLTINDRIVFASCLAQDQNERILWGQEAYDSQQGPVYKWLKLFLYDPDHPILQEPDAPKLPEGSLPEKLVTLYLRQVYDAITEMIRIHHSDCDQGTDYWFGWPATWSDESQQKMMRAVQEAGYGNDSDRVFFLTEAEAVALFFTQHEKLGKPPSSLSVDWQSVKLGDGRILICDIGGGTTDVVALQIQNSGTNPTYELLSKSSGNDCGLAAMDAALRGHVRGLHGVPSQQLLDKIGNLKRRFTGKEDRPIFLPGSGQRTALPGDIKKCLNPTIEKILALILENINASRQMQLPISGTAEVLYLQEYAPISVAWGATLRGALGRAIPRLKFDRSYGLEVTSEAIVHEEGLDTWIRRKKSTPHWFVRKNQEYAIDQQERRIFNIFHRAGDPATKIINIVEHPGTCPSPDDGINLVPKGVFQFCLRLQDRDSILRTGDECSIKVQIAWTLTYSEQQAGVDLVASVKDAELGREVKVLDGHEVVH
ncbi:uncharacterized protein An02g00710 [Aspergillus niger]|uniref:Contig An02c0010, genomic contig n=2 Tax=Aspergillus niger TaxID=5061 RepID=A2QBN9_ASPNC|nr:uncharacterized protein An02g00710 [Aspergillus niger]CAK96286.1 unnamed protein product [Aspergillus niger]